VLITHRVAAAARCDSIIVLDHGRVVERGTHAELLAAGGRYEELYRTQFQPDPSPHGSPVATSPGADDYASESELEPI
jgi:ABC-type multidrug transport system ATPase subunit